MSGSASYYNYITASGVILSDTSAVLSTVQGEWQGVFGATLNVAQSTAQGLMIAAEALARSNVIKNNTVVANQINPNQAGGLFLDAICALTGLTRNAATFSTYGSTVVISGQANTPVPVGFLATTVNGDYFQTLSNYTVGSGGTVTVAMSAVNSGPVPAPSGVLTPFTAVVGVETIAAASAGTVGVVAQSDVNLRTQRRQTLALQGIGFTEAVTSALNALPGVIGIKFLENKSSSTATVSGISMAGSSVWACVDGGVNSQIAAALYDNVGQGVGFNGSVTQSYTDPYSGQAFTVSWAVPTLEAMLVQITVLQGTFAGDLITSIQTAILNWATNQVQSIDPNSVISGIQVGDNFSPFQISSAVAAQCPGVYVREVQVSYSSTVSYVTTEITMAINQKPTVTAGGINVIVATS
jgi:hypothetical protein